MPLLNEIVGKTFYPKNGDEQRFWDKHVVTLFKNIYSEEEYDKLFKGSTTMSPRESERHGYSPGKDEDVYESVELDENYTLNHLLDCSSWHSRKHGLKMGHVAQAVVDASKETGLGFHTIMAHNKIGRDYSGYEAQPSVRYKPKNNIFGQGNNSLAKMDSKKAIATIKGSFEKHLKKAIKKGSTFNPESHDELKEALVLRVNEEVIEEGLHNFKHHMRALYRTAKEHAVPVGIIATAIATSNVHPVAGTIAAGAGLALGGAHKHIVQAYHRNLEDSKEGIHEHNNGQLGDELDLQHKTRKSSERSFEENTGEGDFSGISGDGLSSDSEEREDEDLSEANKEYDHKDWVSANKKRFTDRYGKSLGTKILKARAQRQAGGGND